MTTVAARAGVIAGDGRETDDDIVVSRCARKVHRLRDGRVVGLSGAVDLSTILLKALSEKLPTPDLGTHVGALMYDTKGKLWHYEGKMWLPVTEAGFYAIGSGACYALAAMMAGADAIAACKIGVALDPFSGGKVRHESVRSTPCGGGKRQAASSRRRRKVRRAARA